MSDILLSICISSYNRGDKCCQLVKRILSIQDERYNIFICDDCSDENTFIKLKSLIDHKVELIQNDRNLGPCSNWFETINCGNGKYILHLLDRDDIDVRYLTTILDILEKNSVGAGYFGKSAVSPVREIERQKNFAVCRKGREAFLMMGVPIHPTGFFVERNIWREKNYKRFFYESNKYGIYPHAYVLGMIAAERDVLYSPIPFYESMYRLNNKRSRFYEKKANKDYWWLPDSVMNTDNRLIMYLSQFADESYKEEFICQRFSHALYRTTLWYKKIAANQLDMERYGLPIKNISSWELIFYSLKYRMVFSHVLKKLQMEHENVVKQVNKIWLENLKTIIREC